MSCYSHKLIIFTLFFSVSILAFVLSSPVPKTSPYDNFIKFITINNCSMPKEINLPFPNLTDPSSNYLSAPVNECRSSSLKEYGTVNMLCTELFDVLKNITCEKYKEPLHLIETEHLSENVCQDFESLKDIIPKKDKYLSGRLSDELTCKVFCSEKSKPLCMTLLWSYNTLFKIQNALSSGAQIQENANQDKETLSDKDDSPSETQTQENQSEVINKASSEKVTSAQKSSTLIVEPEQSSQNMKKTSKSKTDDILQPKEATLPESNLKQNGQEIHSSKVSDDLSEVTLQAKKVSLNLQSPDGFINQTTSSTKNLPSISLQNKSQPEHQKSTPEDTENSIKPIESSNLSNLSPQSEDQDDTENKINVDEKLSKKVVNNISVVSSNENSLPSNVNGIKDIKNETVSNLSNNGNNEDNGNNDVGSKTNEKSAESIAPPVENNDNEIKNNFPEEDKSKTKQVDIENKETEKQKQTDYEGPNEVLPDNDSKLSESSTQLPIPDEDNEHPEDKDQDQNYNENDGDYVKSEYDSSFNSPAENKEFDVKNPIPVDSNQLPNGYDSNTNPRSNIGRISGGIAMIAPFPEQEDSHFFFYFLSIVLIIMAGYLIFHNKQKIIALIVEGRHERRRRSHGAGYKKLETK